MNLSEGMSRSATSPRSIASRCSAFHLSFAFESDATSSSFVTESVGVKRPVPVIKTRLNSPPPTCSRCPDCGVGPCPSKCTPRLQPHARTKRPESPLEFRDEDRPHPPNQPTRAREVTRALQQADGSDCPRAFPSRRVPISGLRPRGRGEPGRSRRQKLQIFREGALCRGRRVADERSNPPKKRIRLLGDRNGCAGPTTRGAIVSARWMRRAHIQSSHTDRGGTRNCAAPVKLLARRSDRFTQRAVRQGRIHCGGSHESFTKTPDCRLYDAHPVRRSLRAFLVGHDRQGRSTLRSFRHRSSRRSAPPCSGPRLSPQAPASGTRSRARIRFRPGGLHRGRCAGSLLLEWVLPSYRR